MAVPVSGHVYFIINRESGLACDIGPEPPVPERLVIGLPFNGHDSQKWKFIQHGPFWIIKNIANERFKDINLPPGAVPGAQVVTRDERDWRVEPDHQFDGHRLFILETELNTGLIPNVAGTPVTLEFRAPIRSQVWELREVD